MNAVRFLVLRTVVTVAALPATGLGAGFLLDPIVTYTNGMPLASSTSLRSHNVYWQCDPEHIGQCDGRYNCPCLNDLHCRRSPRFGNTGPVPGRSEHLPDGMEAEDGAVLGVVSIDPSAPHRDIVPPAAPPAAAAGSSGGVWIDALQTLQRKMMIDPDKGY